MITQVKQFVVSTKPLEKRIGNDTWETVLTAPAAGSEIIDRYSNWLQAFSGHLRVVADLKFLLHTSKGNQS